MSMTWQAANAWVPLQEPARDVAAPTLQISPRDAPVPRSLTLTSDVVTLILRTSAIDLPTPRQH